ncbi:MAG: hypothetical protein ABGZ17_09235 [Planctomycetaceae bacterium]
MASWGCLESDIPEILSHEADPIGCVAQGHYAACIVRQAFPAADCRALVDLLQIRNLIGGSDGKTIDPKALPVEVVDRWTQQGLNPRTSGRSRIDLGASLGNYGDDAQDFFRRSVEAQQLFADLFQNRPDPIAALYDHLQQLAPARRVSTAHEADGRTYGPAIIRVHYGGYTYGPHFDSVRLRESRSEFAVYKYRHQLAGVLCLQNSTRRGVSAQGIIHRQPWNEQVDPYLKSGRFDAWIAERDIEQVCVELEPGDLYFFNTGMIHEVPGVPGDDPRIVLAVFIGYSPDDPEIMVWS